MIMKMGVGSDNEWIFASSGTVFEVNLVCGSSRDMRLVRLRSGPRIARCSSSLAAALLAAAPFLADAFIPNAGPGSRSAILIATRSSFSIGGLRAILAPAERGPPYKYGR